MKILIVGGGGREHALAWKCSEPSYVDKVFCAPGNAGTLLESKVENISIEPDNLEGLAEFAERQKIDLTVVGPEAALVAGIVDRFKNRNLKCFGPTKSAAILEGSKVFAKEFLIRHGIPTARYESFDEIERALEYLRKVKFPIVIKADGLASGKGVFISARMSEAKEIVESILSKNQFGIAGNQIVIEEFLEGEELSYICMTDGCHCVPFASSQDHKARDDGDKGPNTGGMGAYSPAPILDKTLEKKIQEDIIRPTLSGLRKEGKPYTGFLYAGLMIGSDGAPKVLEFNCRLGDPETQPILSRLKTDLVAACLQVLKGKAENLELEFDEKTSVGVVLAAKGYPGLYKTGMRISGLTEASEKQSLKIFHAGTRDVDGNVVSNGGRVLCVVGMGDDIEKAQTASYDGISLIKDENFFCRSDIGYRAIRRKQETN